MLKCLSEIGLWRIDDRSADKKTAVLKILNLQKCVSAECSEEDFIVLKSQNFCSVFLQKYCHVSYGTINGKGTAGP